MRARFFLSTLCVLLVSCKRMHSPPAPDPPASTYADFGERPARGQPGSSASNADLTVDFLNAGQGDCIHIGCPTGESILVDCGSTANRDPDFVGDVAQRLGALQGRCDLERRTA